MNDKIMDDSSDDDKDVEYLMRLEPDVTLAREESLRDPHGVEECTSYIEDSHQGDIEETDPYMCHTDDPVGEWEGD